MTIRRTAFIATLALGLWVAAAAAADAQQAGAAPEHIRATQAFLMAWGNQRWDELRTIASDHVTVKLGTNVFTLDPAAQKSEVTLIFPFRGMSTVRTDGKVTGIRVDDLGLKVGEREIRGPGMINLQEVNGQFQVTAVSAEASEPSAGAPEPSASTPQQ